MDEAIPWKVVSPADGESFRWECVDGRWVSVARGHGVSEGRMLVLDSAGRCESARSLADALELAQRWRRSRYAP